MTDQPETIALTSDSANAQDVAVLPSRLTDLRELAYLAYLLVDSGLDSGRPTLTACKPLIAKVTAMLDAGWNFERMKP